MIITLNWREIYKPHKNIWYHKVSWQKGKQSKRWKMKWIYMMWIKQWLCQTWFSADLRASRRGRRGAGVLVLFVHTGGSGAGRGESASDGVTINPDHRTAFFTQSFHVMYWFDLNVTCCSLSFQTHDGLQQSVLSSVHCRPRTG